MEIKDSLLPTSVTYSGEFLSSDAKIPTLFEINEDSSKNVANDGLLFRDGDGDANSYRIVDDAQLLNELENGEWEEVYRVMQVIDGKLYPPMAAVREGDLVEPIRLGMIEHAEQHHDKVLIPIQTLHISLATLCFTTDFDNFCLVK